MKPITGIFLFYSVLVLLSSCSTKLEVNAPYRETKVMYSILDPTLPFQTIRISKGFLSDGRSALDIAKNSPDSSLYDPNILVVELIEKKSGKETGRWTCVDTLLTDKPDGVFYSPDQVVYKTPVIRLDTTNFANTTYTFRVYNKATQNVSEAVTNLPARNFRVIEPVAYFPTDPISLNFRTLADTRIRVSQPLNVEVAQITFDWTVLVYRNTGGIIDSTYEIWVMNTPGIAPIQGTEAQGLVGRGQFWSYIQRELANHSNSNVTGRKFVKGRMDVYGGNKEYDNYRTVNGNYNVITQSLPIYTNVSNGLGIVCSRNMRSFTAKLSNSVLDTLKVRVPDFKLVK